MAHARDRKLTYSKRFYATDWLNDSIEVISEGVPTEGQLGPHFLPIDGLFETKVFKYQTGLVLQEVGIHANQYGDGRVVIKKTSLTPAFYGIILVRANRYE